MNKISRFTIVVTAVVLLVLAFSAVSPIVDVAAVSSAPMAATATVAAILTQAPAGTTLVVLDQNGNALPLATQAAAKTVKKGDPIWCPAGQKPGGAGCTAAETTVASLITDLASESGAGTVYFESTYSTPDATFDQVSMPGLTDLTIQGGWNGKTGTHYKLSGVSAFSVPLTVKTGPVMSPSMTSASPTHHLMA